MCYFRITIWLITICVILIAIAISINRPCSMAMLNNQRVLLCNLRYCHIALIIIDPVDPNRGDYFRGLCEFTGG